MQGDILGDSRPGCEQEEEKRCREKGHGDQLWREEKDEEKDEQWSENEDIKVGQTSQQQDR